MNILTQIEGKRGCGYRKEGGLYLVSEGLGRYCGALPIELEVCPTCHHGIKPSRGWTWIDLSALAAVRGCSREGGCGNCPIADAKIQQCGLLWVGEQFYKTPAAFAKEAGSMGISRRIQAVPRGFVVGETWVALAHRKAIESVFKLGEEPTYKSAIFHVFRPQRIEYIVKKGDSNEKLEDLEKRGMTLVKVVRKGERAQKEMAV
jgi:hypothetical protein